MSAIPMRNLQNPQVVASQFAMEFEIQQAASSGKRGRVC